jgi:tol-pal system protein YbgF
LASAALALFLAPSAVPAHAASKEIIELQAQVQQLLDQMQRMQSTLDQKFAVLQHMSEQTADEANQMTAAVGTLQKQIDAQSQASTGKTDAVSGQVQSLNDSVDELKTRITKLDKSIQDLQSQLQQIQAQAAAAPAQGAPGSAPGTAPVPGQPLVGGPSAAAQAPPLEETYQAGLRDFSAGKYSVAAGEFQDVVHFYPLDDMAGTAQFYLGEIAYQQQNYNDAINAYNAVLEGFSGNAKAPAAQLHKGYALLAQNKKDAGVRELRLLIQRYPRAPEAGAARSKLNGLGVKITATAPAASAR